MVQTGVVQGPGGSRAEVGAALLSCSREALDPSHNIEHMGSKQPRFHEEGPNPTARGEEPGSNPERRNQDALWVSQNSAAETKILLTLGSALLLPIEAQVPLAIITAPPAVS